MTCRKVVGPLLLASALSLGTASSIANDKVTFGNASSSEELGFILDGKREGKVIQDEVHVLKTSNSKDVGKMTRYSDHDEVVGFQKGKMVGAIPAGWTDTDGEERSVSLRDQQRVGISVWFVKEDTPAIRERAAAALVLASAIWSEERMGLVLGSVTYHGEHAGTVPKLERIRCTSVACKEGLELKALGYDAGKVNVYYVDEVHFGDGWSTSNGVWCNTDLVILGGESLPDLLSHEFGHALSLGHVSGPNFDETNVMWDRSATRAYFTEGQVFRSHIRSNSVINSTYNLRPSEPVEHETEKYCPALELRIWEP